MPSNILVSLSALFCYIIGMFHYDPNCAHWEALSKSYDTEGLPIFSALLSRLFDDFYVHEDELRLLFYAGSHCGPEAYRTTLSLIAAQPDAATRLTDERIAAFRYALEHSLPPGKQCYKKHYLSAFTSTVAG